MDHGNIKSDFLIPFVKWISTMVKGFQIKIYETLVSHS